MKRTMGGAVLLAAAVALAPMQVHAQQGPRAPQRRLAPAGGAGVEMILRQKERLGLTDAQVTQLDQIREELVAQRTAHQAELAELTSKVRAGELEPSALRERLQARRDSAQELRTKQRERVEAILTDEQKQKVETWGATARGFRMGRQSVLRGRAGVGPGMLPGAWMRGRMQRFAPGQRGWGMRRGPGLGLGFGPPGDTTPR